MDFYLDIVEEFAERIGRAVGYLLNIFPREVPEQ